MITGQYPPDEQSTVDEPHTPPTCSRPAEQSPPPSSRQIMLIWLALGAQSFGGGTATLELIRREIVERRHWLTAEEFVRCWAVCQIAPGINLLGLTTLIGWRLARARGVLFALLGLLLPSASITVLMTMLYARIQQLPLIRAALEGIVPGTVGLGLLLAWRMARPPLQTSRQEGSLSFGVSIALLLGSIIAVSLFRLPIIGVVWGAGIISALFHWYDRRT